MTPSARDRLSSAFRRAYEAAGLSQEALSDATGIRQATISKYARGEIQPSLDVMETVSLALSKPRDHILRLADYVSDDIDIETAIMTDPTLTEDGRAVVLAVYQFSRSVADPPRRNSFAIGPPDREPTAEELAAIEPPFTDDYELAIWEDPEIIERHKRREIWLYRNGYLDHLINDGPADGDVEHRAS